jgi:hypothetical protein
MKRTTYLVIAVAAAVTLLLEVMAASRPASAGGVAFMVWGVSPYLYLAALNRWMKAPGPMRATLIIAVLAGLIGIWMLFDATFLNLDAQSGLAFLFTPLWQWFLLLIASVPLYLANRYAGPSGS